MTIDPDEIFLDTYNLPDFDRQQFEGERERPISRSVLSLLAGFFCLIGLVFLIKVFNLQVVNGQTLATRGETNTLRQTPIFAERGVIYDRRGQELAWNNPERTYLELAGLSHLLGYVGYPSNEDLTTTTYLPEELTGRDGVEKIYNERLRGVSGINIEEVDARGLIRSEYSFKPAESGASLWLSIDGRLQNKLYDLIKTLAVERGFLGGAVVVLDVHTGELLSLVSYP